jgi:hypothetical protein
LKAFNDIEVPVTVLPPDPDLFAENIFDHPIRTVDLDQGNLTTSPPLLCFFLEVEGAVFWTFSIVIRGGLETQGHSDPHRTGARCAKWDLRQQAFSYFWWGTMQL